jgi:hypothetical protein
MKVPKQVNTTSVASCHLSKHTSTETLIRYASSGAIGKVDSSKTVKAKIEKKHKMGNSKSQGTVGLMGSRDKPAPTFGHRPQSASRHFDKLSMSVNHRRLNMKSSTAPKIVGGTGMSLDNLNALLDVPPENTSKTTMNGSDTRLSHINRRSYFVGMGGESNVRSGSSESNVYGPSLDDGTSTSIGTSFDGGRSKFSNNVGRTFHDDSPITAKPSKTAVLEAEWNNGVYILPKIKKAPTHLPANPEESIKERMRRYAKISAGVALNEEPAHNEVMRRTSQSIFKSPRTTQTDKEVAIIFERERERQRKIEEIEEKHRYLVKKERMHNFKEALKKKVEAKGGPMGKKRELNAFA